MNLKSISNHLKSHIALIFFFPLALGINLYFRSTPINFPQFRIQAKEMINQAIQENVSRDVYSRFPQYDPLARERLIKSQVAEYIKQNRKEIDKQAEGLYQQVKGRFQDNNNQTYLMELDCWHWAKYVEEVFSHGFPGDEVVNGRHLDKSMLAPQGSFLLWDDFLLHFSSWLYAVCSFFRYIPLFTFLFYLPLLFITLFIVVLYLFTQRLSGHLGAAISCLFAGLASMFIPRSCAGWFDKDIWNLLFPTLIVFTYAMTYRSASLRQGLKWAFFTAFWSGLFCYTWTSWWFIFLIIIIYEAVSIAFHFIVIRWFKRDENRVLLRQHVISFAVYLAGTLFWILVLCGFQPLEYIYNQTLAAVFLTKPLMSSIWPNVFYTVGELRRMNLQDVTRSIGDVSIFWACVCCMAVILVRNILNKKYTGFRREAIILLTLWFLAMIYACFNGVRFTMFLTVPLGISLGWAVNDIYRYFADRDKLIEGGLIAAVLFVFLNVGVIGRADKVSKSLAPLMNDTWYSLLTAIKDNTPKDAVLNSWWDFGDWFKVVARRKVIFDGQSQDSARAYWMGKAITSNNEKETLGILRMLNNSGNEAFEAIEKRLNNPLKSVLLLESVLPLEPRHAGRVLRKFLPPADTEKVLKLLFNKPPPCYFVVENTMISKMPAISYLGSWNFSKVYIAQNLKKQEKEPILEYLDALGKDQNEMRKLYQEAFLISGGEMDNWISHPIQFYSNVVRGHEKDGNVFFENGFVYNMKEHIVTTNSGQVPQSLFMLNGGTMVEVEYPNPSLAFSILVYRASKEYRAILLDRRLGNSLFVRLFFLNGIGMRHFIPEIAAEEGEDCIKVYGIKW